jgi:hypothetical protein
MSNNPVLPIMPNGEGPLKGNLNDDEAELQTENPDLDEGESADDQATVEADEREAADVNDKLTK